MRQFMIAGLAVALFAAASTAFAADEVKASFKIGGGALYNAKADSGSFLGGGHVALDFFLPGKQIVISPFMDYYKGSGRTTVLSGLDFLVRTRMNSERANVYFGVGAGFSHQRFTSTLLQLQTVNVTDSTGAVVVDSTGAAVTTTKNVPVSASMRPNKVLIDFVAGLDIKASDKVSFFIKPRYVWSGSATLSGLTTNLGLVFHMR